MLQHNTYTTVKPHLPCMYKDVGFWCIQTEFEESIEFFFRQ